MAKLVRLPETEERSQEARMAQIEIPNGAYPLRVLPHPRHNGNKQTKDSKHRCNQEKALDTADFVCLLSEH
jgi:hypothetical protein